MAENSSIIVCGQRFDVGRRVITWQDDPTISAYTPHCVTHAGIFPTSPAKGLGHNALRYRARRLIGADRSLSRLGQVLRQFVVHHDGMNNSRNCFKVLHDERGLSVHFLIDNNGDIYQTLDLVDCAFQAAGVNEISVGVELCNRGDALRFPDFYHGAREKLTCTINQHQFLAYDFTKEQYDSMFAVGKALARIFPNLPQTCPENGGQPLWATLDDPRKYSGYLGHYHVSRQKWDPGPWDFKRFLQGLRGSVFYPAVPGEAKSELPADATASSVIADELYENNETEGEGGYFPVGPLGETRLWHGGLHLRDERGKPVVAPFAGRLIAARQKVEDDWPSVGSPNFVLLRHDLSVGDSDVRFFTLLFHLDDENADPDGQPAWMKHGKDKKWFADLARGEVAILDEPVTAGEPVGHFGEAGKPGNWQGVVHFEIFSVDELGAQLEPDFWKALDGTRGGRFCTLPEIINPIDRDHSQSLAHSEIVNFFHNNPARAQFHKLAVRHVSEWGDRNDWWPSLNKARDFGRLTTAQKRKLFAEQIQSMLWWGDNIDADSSLGLPSDKLVWGYHPITFVSWMNSKLRGATATRAKGVESASAFRGEPPPANIQDDADATDGFMDDEDALFGEAAKNLDLEHLAAGYPDDKL